MEDERETSLLRSSGRNKSSMSLSCCFGGGHRHGRSLDFDASSLFTAITPSKSTDLPENRGMYKPSKPRKGRNRRRHSSADFSYDPLSYSLNFEEPSEAEERISCFTSRLPLSPPRDRAPISSSTVSASAPFPASISLRLSSEQQTLSRVDAVAEVKKSLEFSTSREEVKRRDVEIPTPRRPR